MSDNIMWAPIVLKIGALIFLAFLVLLVFRTIRHQQQQTKEMAASVDLRGFQVTTNVFPIFVALLAGVAALWVAFSGGLTSIEIHEPVQQILMPEERSLELQVRIESLEKKYINLQQTAISVSGVEDGSDFNNLLVLLAESKTVSDENSNAIKSFESLILSDAEKLLTLPLLKRDLGSVGNELNSLKSEVNTLRSLVSESNNQNRWLIGTLALGMLALVLPAIRSVMSGGKNDQGKSSDDKEGSNQTS
jgi:hypothetical protein